MIKYALRDLIQVGQFYRSVGVKGEIGLELNEGFSPVIDNINYLFVERNGQSLPLFVESFRERNGQLIVKLEKYNGPEEVVVLSNKEIYLDKERIADLGVETQGEESNLSGFQLYNEEVFVGNISEILIYPSQNMIAIEGKDILIPLVEDWVVEIEHESKIFRMSFDPELLSLNE